MVQSLQVFVFLRVEREEDRRLETMLLISWGRERGQTCDPAYVLLMIE